MRSALFQIRIENDEIIEGTERFILGLSGGQVLNTDGGAVNTTDKQTIVLIEDDDSK